MASGAPPTHGMPGREARWDGARSQATRGCGDLERGGHGDGRTAGRDCDDSDARAQSECLRCAPPARGCCDPGAKAQSSDARTLIEGGAFVCAEGTRYCREDTRSRCESLHTHLREHRVRHDSGGIARPHDAGTVVPASCFFLHGPSS